METLKELFSLGLLYPSDFLKEGSRPRCEPVELKLMLDGCNTTRLETTAPNHALWGQYWYRSGINTTMRLALQDIAQSISKVFNLKDGGIWIDIACNDGTLLSFVPSTMIPVGIDPADDTFKKEAEKHAAIYIQDYFSAEAIKKAHPYYARRKAKVITAIAMFYDVPNPDTFLSDIDEILDDNGIFVMQLSYTPLMLTQMAFDNIVHEHLYYYSFFNIKKLLEKRGFQIMDCQLNDVNAGSFRLYIMKMKADIRNFATQAYRDVCNLRVNSLLEYEKNMCLDDKKTWTDFYDRINKLKEDVVNFIKDEKANGKTIYAYAASTKGNTLLQYFGLDNTLIDAVADRNYTKWGLKTVGTNIPIVSEDEMRKANPDYLLILAWHFVAEFKEREKEYLDNGGKFIIPCPKFEIIGK